MTKLPVNIGIMTVSPPLGLIKCECDVQNQFPPVFKPAALLHTALLENLYHCINKLRGITMSQCEQIWCMEKKSSNKIGKLF